MRSPSTPAHHLLKSFCCQKKSYRATHRHKTTSTPKPCIFHAKILKADYGKHNRLRAAYDKITIDATERETHAHTLLNIDILYIDILLDSILYVIMLYLHCTMYTEHTQTFQRGHTVTGTTTATATSTNGAKY